MGRGGAILAMESREKRSHARGEYQISLSLSVCVDLDLDLDLLHGPNPTDYPRTSANVGA